MNKKKIVVLKAPKSKLRMSFFNEYYWNIYYTGQKTASNKNTETIEWNTENSEKKWLT